MTFIRKAFLGASCLVLATAADAQVATQFLGAQGPGAAQVRAPALGGRGYLSEDDRATLRQAVDAAQAGDIDRARALQSGLSDPLARKLVLWAMADSSAERLSFFELDQARRDLWGWPRAGRRQVAAEKQLETQGMSPQAVIDWFKGQEPSSPEGAMALASAYRGKGDTDAARRLIRRFWREKTFEVDPQQQMLARFGDLLSVDDHVRRADMLLYGQQGPAARDLIALLPGDRQTVAQARMAYRSGAGGQGDQLLERLPANLADDPGLTFERVRYLRRQKQIPSALALIRNLPKDPPSDEAGSTVWVERRGLIAAALSNRDYDIAYKLASENGLKPGVDYAEAEFYAGWIALTKLKRPGAADRHFAHIQDVGSSPITQARALYWRGRANEADGDPIAAKDFYSQGSEYPTTFYGQLAAERAGMGEFSIGKDPVPSAADRARFEGRELIQAARYLNDAGEKDLFRTFVLTVDDTLPNAEEYALLVDMIRGYGDQDLSMRVVRVAAQHAYILPERGYPMRATPPRDAGDPELALVYGITRQESGFDPKVRSGVGARGMMQLMPATAQQVARRLGVGYSASSLDDPDYNMRLGASYLGQVIDNFSGSYVLGTASYNAGPGRMNQWSAICGDPRGTSNDPVDFIECIPISETRNYVMRVMEGMQVYRARLNGGKAPLTLSQDLKRGIYTPGATPLVAMTDRPSAAVGSATMAPIPD